MEESTGWRRTDMVSIIEEDDKWWQRSVALLQRNELNVLRNRNKIWRLDINASFWMSSVIVCFAMPSDVCRITTPYLSSVPNVNIRSCGTICYDVSLFYQALRVRSALFLFATRLLSFWVPSSQLQTWDHPLSSRASWNRQRLTTKGFNNLGVNRSQGRRGAIILRLIQVYRIVDWKWICGRICRLRFFNRHIS